MRNGVFIAMPVYRGTEFIEETLRSILAQTHQDWHLVMSVDGGDDPTIEVCRKYEHDPRIDVVVQETRLGWPGNFNWLVENCDREFFCYWQQDDLTSTGYLESLRRELLARPDAAIAYTDVQWFGARFDRNRTPSIEGDSLSRVMQHIEAIGYGPLRGLMRSSMLPDSEAIPVTQDESCQEEFVFLTHMAAAGAFIRVESAMYFKRLHASNVFVRWAHFPYWRRRRGWISMGLGMYQIARELAPPEMRPRILSQIIDRLAIERHGRAHFYVPTQSALEIHLFVRDFVAYGAVAAADLGPVQPAQPLERPIDLFVLDALRNEEMTAQRRADLQRRLTDGESLAIDLKEEKEAGALLGFGWSAIEPWGVWSDGGEATLRIPAPPGRPWRTHLLGQVYGTTEEAVPFRVGTPNGLEVNVEARPNENLTVVVESDGEGDVVRLQLPQARSPNEDGVSADERTLGFALMRLTVELI